MDVRQDIISRFEKRTKASRELDARAKRSLPGGDTRWATYYLPYPAYMVGGSGCRMRDADGNEYIDFLNNYTSLVHGHRHPRILEAVKAAIEEDFIYGAPTESQFLLANLITDRLPGVARLRYTNSGTEATMMAMRTARLFTGKEIIIKMDGCYHGSHDFAEVNISPDLGTDPLPVPRTEAKGIPACILDAMKVARFNDLASVEQLLETWKGQVAGIITEPILNQGGIIQAKPEFLKGLRELADRYGVLLIFDEVVSFRTSTGGMQQLSGVIPDLTALGKLIGGGFPAGAFGGREEVMAIFDPAGGSGYHHSGTFNGHNVTMRAGAVAVEMLDQPAIDRLNALGARLQLGIDSAFRDTGIAARTSRFGSLLYVHWTNGSVETPRDVALWKQKAADLPRLFHLDLLTRGVFSANRGLMNISTPMTEEDIDSTIFAVRDSLDLLKSVVADKAPHLLR
jgi:glutamate-1-semialdehyde 2,1-aminomutase